MKVRSFPGATTEDMHEYIKPLLIKPPNNVILHVGTNNTPTKFGKSVLEKILELKSFIETQMPERNVNISNLVKKTDSIEATSIVDKVNE